MTAKVCTIPELRFHDDTQYKALRNVAPLGFQIAYYTRQRPSVWPLCFGSTSGGETCTGVHMSRILRSVVAGICLLIFAAAAHAQTEVVGTSASETAAFGTAGQTFGPFPWSALGITASASVTPGTLDVQTGGSTSFNLPSGAVTPGESFVPGSTVLDLGYTPGFKGSSISGAPAASGTLSSAFQYNLGPLGSGTVPLVNATVPVLGLGTANVNTDLDNGLGVAALSQATGTAPAGLTLNAQAQVCFIVCATVASASISFDVSGQTSQNVIATPTVTYGDYVWESKTQTWSSSAVFVPGAAGEIANVFTDPSGLGLTNGQTFYFNFLPAVQVNMPVVNTAEVAVPASITASYDIFGFGGSETWPLGNLYSLSTGGSFDFNPTFNGSEFYSIPLVYENNPNCLPGEVCSPFFNVGPGGPTTTNGGGTVPGGSGPDGCGSILLDCNINVPDNPPTPDGYSNTPPILPGPTFNSPDPCEPAGVALPPGATCNTIVNQTTGIPTPEPGGVALLGLGLVGLAIMSRRRLCS
jgi:hypothetical protein